MLKREKQIVQIIPAPSNMFAFYGTDDKDEGADRVICLALVEYPDGFRCVEAMTTDGQAILIEDSSNFVRFGFM